MATRARALAISDADRQIVEGGCGPGTTPGGCTSARGSCSWPPGVPPGQIASASARVGRPSICGGRGFRREPGRHPEGCPGAGPPPVDPRCHGAGDHHRHDPDHPTGATAVEHPDDGGGVRRQQCHGRPPLAGPRAATAPRPAVLGLAGPPFTEKLTEVWASISTRPTRPWPSASTRRARSRPWIARSRACRSRRAAVGR